MPRNVIRKNKYRHNKEEVMTNKIKNTIFIEEKLTLTTEWDKTFAKSSLVEHKKVTFHNRYGITLAADMYVPKNAGEKLSAIAVAGPFGAVKEQASGLYAQTLAEKGFLTIAFDPSYTRGKRRTAQVCGFPGHQHGGFLCRSGFFVSAGKCGFKPDRNPGNLRLGRNGTERRRNGHKNQSHRNCNDVRYEPGYCQWIL